MTQVNHLCFVPKSAVLLIWPTVIQIHTLIKGWPSGLYVCLTRPMSYRQGVRGRFEGARHAHSCSHFPVTCCTPCPGWTWQQRWTGPARPSRPPTWGAHQDTTNSAHYSEAGAPPLLGKKSWGKRSKGHPKSFSCVRYAFTTILLIRRKQVLTLN